MAEPVRILMRERPGGRRRACATARRFAAAAFVASGLNPQQTFLELLDAGSACRQERERAARLPLQPARSAVRAEPLCASRPLPGGREASRAGPAFMVILGLEASPSSTRSSRPRGGQIPPTVMWGACPTLFDPSQAPPGGHTAFMWEKLPYALHGDPANWDRGEGGARPGDAAISGAYAPNLAGRGARLLHPLAAGHRADPAEHARRRPARRLLRDDQVGYHRPFPGAGEYRTPLPGLYLCGGSTHPGGNITGLCGYNAAQVIPADLGIDADWIPHAASFLGSKGRLLVEFVDFAFELVKRGAQRAR